MKCSLEPEESINKEAAAVDRSRCPYRVDQHGKIMEHPYFNPRCKRCTDCMWDNQSPLQCPITKQKCFGGEVIKDGNKETQEGSLRDHIIDGIHE